MDNTEFLDNYEKTLERGLLRVCSSAELLSDELLESPDIDEMWDTYAKDYIADAVENFNDYSEAAIAWAGVRWYLPPKGISTLPAPMVLSKRSVRPRREAH